MIVIPALGLSRPSEWKDPARSPWLQELVEQVVPGNGTNAFVWEFLYSLDQWGSLAQQILGAGRHLLQALYHHCILTQVRYQVAIQEKLR